MSKDKSVERSFEEIKKGLDVQIEFLKLVHPEIASPVKEDEYRPERLEVRFIERFPHRTSRSQYSFSTWVLNEESSLHLYEKLLKYNGLTCCTYYSLYSFNKKVLSDKGKELNLITKRNALSTFVLPMDFDGMTEQEFLEQKQILLDLGIETLDVFSGNGYQSLILLDKKSEDKDLFEKFTTLMLRKGFRVDSKIKDRARVFRLPNSFNCKQFKMGDKHFNPVNPKGIKTYIYTHTTKRYDLNKVFKLIESLPNNLNEINATNENEGNNQQDTNSVGKTLVGIDALEQARLDLADVFAEQESNSIKYAQEVEINNNSKLTEALTEPFEALEEDKEEETEDKVFTTGDAKEKINVSIETKEKVAELYKHLDYLNLPEAVQLMLMGTPAGSRNSALLFLIPLLKNYAGLSIQQQRETLQTWGEKCTPPLEKKLINSEFTRLTTNYDIQAMYGLYSEDLEKLYGELVFEEWKTDDEIIIPNSVFERMDEITDGAFKLYLGIKMLAHEENRENFTNEEISNYMGITVRTFEKHIGPLRKGKFVNRKTRSRTKGEKYEYYVNPFESSSKGFTKIKTSLVELLFLKDINDAQIKFFIYLKHMIGNSDKSCWASQQYLAKALGKKQNTISDITNGLHEKKFIRKETKKVGRVTHSTYIIIK